MKKTTYVYFNDFLKDCAKAKKNNLPYYVYKSENKYNLVVIK